MTVQASPTEAQGQKAGIPKNPGRADLGLKATLLFPNREIVERYYVPLIYTACRTCYSELTPEDIFGKAAGGEIDQAKMQRSSNRGTARPSSTSSSPSASAASRERCRTSSCAIARAWPSTSRASAT